MNDASTAAALKRRPYRLYLVSRILSTLAGQMLAVVVGWQVYALSGSTFYLGLVGLAQFLPMFLLTLVVGHVADRYDRRLVATFCQIAEGLLTLLLGAATLGGWISTNLLLIVVFFGGVANAFQGPSMQALMPGLVTVEEFPRAAAWSTSVTQTAAIVGPAAGGVLYALGADVSYAVVAGLLIVAAFVVLAIGAGRVAEQPRAPREAPTLRSVFAGIEFIRRRPVIFGAISLDLFAVLLGGATALLPAYTRDILHSGPWGLGLLRAAPSAGAVVVSLGLARWPLRRKVGRTMNIAVVIFGLATVGFAVSRSFSLSLAALIVLGGADVISMVVRSSLVQLKTPDEMRGRVSAVNSLFIGTSNQLGEFESGVTAAWFGLVPAVVIGGLGTLVVVFLWTRLFPELAAADRLDAS